MEQDRPARIFISYAREDEEVKKRFITHLSSLRIIGFIQFWDDSMIRIGDEWNEKIQKRLEEADIFLFLVSSYFIDSKYINEVELKVALEKYRQGMVILVFVIAKDCNWKNLTWDDLKISDFQVTPKLGMPITNTNHWGSPEEGYAEVVQDLEKMVTNWKNGGGPGWGVDVPEDERKINLIISQISEPDIRKLEKELRMNPDHWKKPGFRKPSKWDESHLFMYCNQQVNAINGLRKQAQRIDPSKTGFISRAINLIEGTLSKNEELKQLVESSGNEDTGLFEKIIQIEKGIVKLKRQIIKNVGEDPEENKLIQADGISTLSYYLEQLENELNIIREKSIFPN